MPIPVFHGRISDDGHLVLEERERERRRVWLESLKGRDVEVVVRKIRVQRSLDQNAYAHAVPFAMIAEEWGEDVETTKLLLLGERFGWREMGEGRRLPIKPSTSKLTVEEFSAFIEWMVTWAAMPGNVCARGFTIPLPNETAA